MQSYLLRGPETVVRYKEGCIYTYAQSSDEMIRLDVISISIITLFINMHEDEPIIEVPGVSTFS